VLRNTLVNGVANVSSAVVTAILTPFLLHRLGAEQYGLWLLALGLTFSSGYLALADIGLPEAAVKFIAEARASGRTYEIPQIASTTVGLFTITAVVVGGAIAALAPALASLFHVAPNSAGVARQLFALMGLEVVMELPGMGLRAVIEGAQEYLWLREGILQITSEKETLESNPTLQSSIKLRNPYVDALSYFQISLLKEWRASGRTRDDLKRAVLLSINGVANGMRNTG